MRLIRGGGSRSGLANRIESPDAIEVNGSGVQTSIEVRPGICTDSRDGQKRQRICGSLDLEGSFIAVIVVPAQDHTAAIKEIVLVVGSRRQIRRGGGRSDGVHSGDARNVREVRRTEAVSATDAIIVRDVLEQA